MTAPYVYNALVLLFYKMIISLVISADAYNEMSH